MLVRFRRGLDDDKAFIDLISVCRTMDYILTNYLPIGFITVPFHSTSFKPMPTAQRSAVPPALVTACCGQAPRTHV